MRPAPRAGRAGTVRAFLPEAGAILIACLLMLVRPAPGWVTGPYARGFYAPLQRSVTGATNRLPFALGDVLIVTVLAVVFILWFRGLQSGRSWAVLGKLALRTAAIAALLYVWFLVAWGWNYDEPALYVRLGYDPAAVRSLSIDAVEDAMVGALNRLAPEAHAARRRAPDPHPALDAAFRTTLATLAIAPGVVETVPKRTLLDPYFVATGIAGMFFPFTFETFLASDVLWFEYPFNLAHEWGHLAGISRESDANFEAALTTLRSQDPVLRYSGLLVVYGAMPRIGDHDRRLSKLVLSDYASMHARDERHIKPIAFKFAWRTYDTYLKAQHVRTGVVNYTEYVQLLLGTAAGREAIAEGTGRAVTLR